MKVAITDAMVSRALDAYQNSAWDTGMDRMQRALASVAADLLDAARAAEGAEWDYASAEQLMSRWDERDNDDDVVRSLCDALNATFPRRRPAAPAGVWTPADYSAAEAALCDGTEARRTHRARAVKALDAVVYRLRPAAPTGEPFVLTEEEKAVQLTVPRRVTSHGVKLLQQALDRAQATLAPKAELPEPRAMDALLRAYQPTEVRPGVYDWRLNPPKVEPAPTLSADLLTADDAKIVFWGWGFQPKHPERQLADVVLRLCRIRTVSQLEAIIERQPKPAPSVLTPEETVGYAVTVYGTHEPAPTLSVDLLTADEREAFRAVFAEAEEIVPEEVGVACAVLARIAPKSAPVVAVESDPVRELLAQWEAKGWSTTEELDLYRGFRAALAARDRSAP